MEDRSKGTMPCHPQQQIPSITVPEQKQIEKDARWTNMIDIQGQHFHFPFH